ncbi:uncharacterized protein METZ01_LOCUS321478, partial [marine metagenome]
MADEGQSTEPPKPSLKLTPKAGDPPKPGGAPKFRVTKSPFAPKIQPAGGETPAPGGPAPAPTTSVPAPTPA